MDLLLEVERIAALEAHADDKNYLRTCTYLLGACWCACECKWCHVFACSYPARSCC